MTDPAADYAQLHAFLMQDPDNPHLIADAARAALAAGRQDAVVDLIARHAAIVGPTPALDHLAGLAAMARQDWPAATALFTNLRADGAQGPDVRFNLAWSLAMEGRKADALPLLDQEVAQTIPQGAQLLVGLLHERGRLDEAMAAARDGVARFPDHRGLNAAVSTLAIDCDDPLLARDAAARAGDHPEALATLATLALDEDRPDEAAALFDAVLARDPGNARGWLGRGMVGLSAGAPSAAADLDRGAALFDTHLGSWIAAGWAHVLAGDTATARARFERAADLDAGFAEAQGSLAFVSLATGDTAEARRLSEIALRLDRTCFAGALVAALLATSEGRTDTAERIVALALNTPVDDAGNTIAQALAKRGARG
ncbi:MAG TPA: tetratricopeptide repeat protein [Sphingomonas sp.]|jgi:tetratricopeptide (TPR) repeat protein|nr:tetratricopeptide repeat protein [Sphingomonas sp.]